MDETRHKRMLEIAGVLKLKLEPWQIEFIMEPSGEPGNPLTLPLAAGRKAGKTQAAGIRLVIDAEESPEGRTLITAKTKGTAAELYRYVVKIIRLLAIPVAHKILAMKCVIANYHEIHLISPGPTGYAIRPGSYTHMYTDEAAFMDDNVYIEAIYAGLAVHGRLEVLLSSAGEAAGFFYDECKKHSKKGWQINSEHVPHVSREWLRKARQRMSRAQYDREVRCIFGRSEDSYIPLDVLRQSCLEMNPVEISRASPCLFLGVDFARSGKDNNALVWAAYFPETKMTYVYASQQVSSQERLTRIVEYIKSIARATPKIRKIVTDEGGVGAGPQDMLVEELGRNRIVGIKNQTRVVDQDRKKILQKQDMYSRMLCALEQGKLKIIKSDKDLFNSLMTLRCKTSYEDILIFGKDDHLAEAMVRAVYLPLSGQFRGGSAEGVRVIAADGSQLNFKPWLRK